MTDLPSSSVLVRTWFGDESAWDSFVLALRTPNEDGFEAVVSLVNDPAFEGLDADGLKARQANGPFASFLADKLTLTHAEHPILAVWVYPGEPGFLPFRVVAAKLWSVENNINQRNMDWPEFTGSLDPDNIFRGF